MKTTITSGLQNRPEQVSTGKRNKRTVKKNDDPAQPELFAVIWRHRALRPFRLHAGDVVQYEGRLCRVIRVTECAAVLVMNRKMRSFTTLFDKQVRFQPAPAIVRISPDSEMPILNP